MVNPAQSLDNRVAFGLRLRELRTNAGLSQEELAHRSGLDRTYVSSCERGRRNVSLDSIVSLAIGLGIAPAELLVDIRRQGAK
ncbi:helix-turn-helix domain-containing protein [Achromobacter sp.]|uniref:helix-turn-helix domain-containing protein n=1 Tax=Achromobacter sp. TaxID=134375 RepID=UPI003C70EBC9